MKSLIKINCSLLPLLFILFMVGNPAILIAQDTAIKKTEEVVLLSPTIELISSQKGDNSIDLKASMRTKFKGSSIRLPHLKVKFIVRKPGRNCLSKFAIKIAADLLRQFAVSISRKNFDLSRNCHNDLRTTAVSVART